MATLESIEQVLLRMEARIAGTPGAQTRPPPPGKEGREDIFDKVIDKFERLLSFGSQIGRIAGGNLGEAPRYVKGLADKGLESFTQAFGASKPATPAVPPTPSIPGGGGGSGASQVAQAALGGEGAGAAGAGEAIAAIGGAASGLLAVVGVAVGLGAAFVGLINATKNLGTSWLESQRQLGEVSGSMAAVLSRWDIFQLQQSQRIGEATAGSAGSLESSLEGLMTELEPYMIALTDLANEGLATATDILTETLDFLRPAGETMIDIMRSVADWLHIIGDEVKGARKDAKKKKEDQTATGWVMNLAKDYDRRKQRGQIGPARA